ncbi:hypothetical protein IWZ01DRAFT_165128 [Phyllosticta capitalensis]
MPRGRYSLARPASALAAHKPLLLSNPLLPAHTRNSSAKTSWQSHDSCQRALHDTSPTSLLPACLASVHAAIRNNENFSLSTFILSALMSSVSQVPSEQSLPPFPLPARRPLHPRKRVPLSHRPSLLHYHRLASQVKHHVRSRRSESSPSPVARPSLSGQCETLPSQEVPHVRSTIHGTTRPNPLANALPQDESPS